MPKVTELFEARIPKNYAAIAKEDGRILFKGKNRGRYILALEYDSKDKVKGKRGEEKGKKLIKYTIPNDRTFCS